MAMATAPILPEDLILEILSWLPVEPLMRFRCVSKTWDSLIFEPYFVKLHRERSSKETQVLLKFKDLNDVTNTWATFCSAPRLIQNPSSSLDDNRRYRLNPLNFFFGSCNGLLCLHESFVIYEYEEHWVRFWNPATRIMSESSPRLCLHSSDYPAKTSSMKYGFGYDHQNDTYKVLAMTLDTQRQQMNVKVYCMGDTCWKNILTCPSFFTFDQVGYSVSGTVNWIGLPTEEDQPETPPNCEFVEIFSYDLTNDTYRYLRVPDYVFDELPFAEPYLGVFNGCLCVSLDQKRSNFIILLLKEIRGETSWTQLLNISYESLQISIASYVDVVFLCMSDHVMLLANYEDSKFIIYDLKLNRIERTEKFSNPFHILSYDYVPSLVLPR
ncbi:unnamed protein product [Sphenostylis stenocarpa]|uniref:F-box domain-containing protein n=1 Tax=Sphenostylis stenocarpa TaxID=92480 RepID=A0AA86SM86_9FABA|nr:unnamed protein product [Sphenostylis stenocarpa]